MPTLTSENNLINVEGVGETHIYWMVVIVDLADRKGNLGVEYMRKMSEEGREGHVVGLL